jgi:hypothetical protein
MAGRDIKRRNLFRCLRRVAWTCLVDRQHPAAEFRQEVAAALYLNIAIVAAITTKEVGWNAAEPRRAGEEAVMTYDLTIRGGTVIDGTGAPARTADVAVIDGVITKSVGLTAPPDARSTPMD